MNPLAVGLTLDTSESVDLCQCLKDSVVKIYIHFLHTTHKIFLLCIYYRLNQLLKDNALKQHYVTFCIR